MKVAIDARPLSQDLTGIGRYTLNLVTALVKNHSDIKWYLFSDRPLIVDIEEQENLKIITGNCSRSFTSTVFTQIYFPIWCKENKINLFWSPRHHLPLALALWSKIKTAVTVHDIVWKKCPETMSKFGLLLEQLLFTPSIKIADKIICVSNFTKSELVENFSINADKVVVTTLQSFLAPTTIGSTQRENSLEKRRYLLFVGTLEPRKNLINILIAYKQRLEKDPELTLVIVGKKGWGQLDLEDKLMELGISKNVVITGFVSDEKLIVLYQHCTALLMPSLYEGFGLPALEALSLKKKVIISKYNAISEMTGDNIYLTDIDPDSIANSIDIAIDDQPKSLAIIGSDWDSVAKETYEVIYNELKQS